MTRYFTPLELKIISNNKNSPEAQHILNRNRVRCKTCGSFVCECNDVTLAEWLPKERK